MRILSSFDFLTAPQPVCHQTQPVLLVFTLSRKSKNFSVRSDFIGGNEQRPTFFTTFTRVLVFTPSRKCNNLTVHDKFIDGNEQRPTFTTFTTFFKGLVSNSLDKYSNYTLKGWETETKQLHATKNHQYHCERCENKEFV